MISMTKAVYEKAYEDTTLRGLVNGRIFEDVAPQNTGLPYIVYSVISEVSNPTFTEKYENYRVQFSVISSESTPTEAKEILKAVKEVFDDSDFRAREGRIISMRRISAAVNPVAADTLNGTGLEWQADVDYDLVYLRDE